MSKSFSPLPHVVILGAGASRAALPCGDKSGKMVPLMDELPKILGSDWKTLVKRANPPKGNFEASFSWIRRSGDFSAELSKIETIIENYFREMELPANPTIYDYLVLGLRKEDVIATFNWDPFLLQAHRRNRDVADLPDIRFLHGCISFRTCTEHDILGEPYENCPKCNCDLIEGRILFPDDKNYDDRLIARDWLAVEEKLKKAFHLTIFGYSGPATDHKARQLLLNGWRQSPVRPFSHVEIIDIKDPEDLWESWKEFIPYGHIIVRSDFWESSVARWPRRTAEWKHSASLSGKPLAPNGPFRSESLNDIQEWFRKLAGPDAEN